MLIKFDEKESSHVTYGDNTRGKILRDGFMGSTSTIIIENMLLVKGLKHNLLSTSQLCKKGCIVGFDPLICLIEHKASKDLVFKGYRIDNIYILDLDDVSMHGIKCLVAKGEDS